MAWDAFTAGIVEQGQKEALTSGLAAWVELYYAEYTDADEIDGAAWQALETLTSIGNADLLDETVPELVARVQREITSTTGRIFKPIES
jgi:hypothetical protein